MSHGQTAAPQPSITYRPGGIDDSYIVFSVFERSFADLYHRLGGTIPTSAADPEALARMWAERRSLYEHLARTAEQFWLAEREGQVVGFARSVLRDGLRQLTEFFVLPGEQSAGVGRELLARAFPVDGAQHRTIISSTDIRAQALYLRAGVYPRFPIYYWWREPEDVQIETDLAMEPLSATPKHLEILVALDRAVLGHRRDTDHKWLLSDRPGFLYRRDGQPAGYGYVGRRNGPFALLQPRDFPAVLAHAERAAVGSGYEFGIEVPMINRDAVDYLLARGFRIDLFTALLMCDEPFGRFENYVLTSPPFIL